jgi:hypothetical protein
MNLGRPLKILRAIFRFVKQQKYHVAENVRYKNVFLLKGTQSRAEIRVEPFMMARKTPSPHIAALGTPRFEFNLHYVGINAVHRLCRERNVNFMEYIRSVGNRVYYNRTFNVENPDWELLADEHLQIQPAKITR